MVANQHNGLKNLTLVANLTALDLTPQLRQRMQAQGITSFAQLQRQSGLTRSQLQRVRQGQAAQLSLTTLAQLCNTLGCSLTTGIQQFCPDLAHASNVQKSEVPTAMAAVETRMLERVQAQVLDQLESLLLQWPTAAHAARQNPTAPAVKLLPLLKPLEQLLTVWNIEAIGTVGESIPFDPQSQTWMGAGDAPDPGTPALVRYVGYRQGDRLLYRAKVS
jgi:DNA-binding Xre family transcriptional regulator